MSQDHTKQWPGVFFFRSLWPSQYALLLSQCCPTGCVPVLYTLQSNQSTHRHVGDTLCCVTVLYILQSNQSTPRPARYISRRTIGLSSVHGTCCPLGEIARSPPSKVDNHKRRRSRTHPCTAGSCGPRAAFRKKHTVGTDSPGNATGLACCSSGRRRRRPPAVSAACIDYTRRTACASAACPPADTAGSWLSKVLVAASTALTTCCRTWYSRVFACSRGTGRRHRSHGPRSSGRAQSSGTLCIPLGTSACSYAMSSSEEDRRIPEAATPRRLSTSASAVPALPEPRIPGRRHRSA
jgi:hypothetical protein